MICVTERPNATGMTPAELISLARSIELPEGLDTEIIDGEIVINAAHIYPHTRILNNIRHQIEDRYGRDTWAEGRDSKAEHDDATWQIPDAFYLATEDGDEVTGEVPLPLIVLSIEVVSPSPGSRTRDYVSKPAILAREGVPVYLLIDYAKRTGEVRWDPDKGKAQYETTHTFSFGDTVKMPPPIELDLDTSKWH
jgi:Uma2 family endonuclease